MNWTSPVYICRTGDPSGDGGSADFADAVEEIVNFAVNANMRAVINYSYGGDGSESKRAGLLRTRGKEGCYSVPLPAMTMAALCCSPPCTLPRSIMSSR